MIEAYIPPHSIESERSVLGSCLLDTEAIIETLSKLVEDDFFLQRHKQVYRAIKELSAKGDPVDIITVSNHDKEIEFQYVAEMASTVATTSNAVHHAEIVYNNAMLRNIIKTTSEITKQCYTGNMDVQEIVAQAETEMLKVNRIVTNKVATIEESLSSALSQLEDRYRRNGEIIGRATGFKTLDNKLGGLQNGELYIIAARPSMGKTSLAENIATHVSITSNLPVVFFSMEMSKERIVDRMISSYGNIDANKIKMGLINDDEWGKVINIAGQLGNSKLYIDDTPNVKALDIKAKCRRIKASKELGLVVIDHLTEIWRPMGGKDVQEHEANVREMKRLAKEMDCPVILLQQLNRGVEHRADKRPQLSDLKETGASEEVADVVIMLYRDDYYNPNTEKKNIAEIIITKGRNIGTGTIEMAWLPQYTKFAELYRGR
jgi:replicative DNA helicase